MQIFFVLCFLAFFFTCEAASVKINDKYSYELHENKALKDITEETATLELGYIKFSNFKGFEGEDDCVGSVFPYTDEVPMDTNALDECFAFSCKLHDCKTKRLLSYYVEKDCFDYEDIRAPAKPVKFVLSVRCGAKIYRAKISLTIKKDRYFRLQTNQILHSSLYNLQDALPGTHVFAIRKMSTLLAPGSDPRIVGNIFNGEQSRKICLKAKKPTA